MQLRNIGIIAHIDAGKTTLTESILYRTGRIRRMGDVACGTTTTDYLPQERKRGITIGAACTSCEWNDTRINIVDTPGHIDFTIEVERSLRVLDGAVGVFCGVAGVQTQSETVWRQADGFGLARVAFVNKLDREGADFWAVVRSMAERLGAGGTSPVVVGLPVYEHDGDDPRMVGVVDLTSGEFWGQGDCACEPPAGVDEAIATAREAMLEALADADAAFMKRYVEVGGDELTASELRVALRRTTRSRTLTPVFGGSAAQGTGIRALLDGVVRYLPAPPEPHTTAVPTATVAYAFKVEVQQDGRRLVYVRVYSGVLLAGQLLHVLPADGEPTTVTVSELFRPHADEREAVERIAAGDIGCFVASQVRTGQTLGTDPATEPLEAIGTYEPVLAMAMEPVGGEDIHRVQQALAALAVEDPALQVGVSHQTGELLARGMGELHLEVVRDRLEQEYGLRIRSASPQVLRHETLREATRGEETVERTVGEQTFSAQVGLWLAPRERGQGNRVHVAAGLDPDQPEIRAALAGVHTALASGPAFAYPVEDVEVRLDSLVASHPHAAHQAAQSGTTRLLAQAGTLLLEPWMAVEVRCPATMLGEVNGLLRSLGAIVDDITEVDEAGQHKVVHARAPLAALFGFATRLRSATRGYATPSLQLLGYVTLTQEDDHA